MDPSSAERGPTSLTRWRSRSPRFAGGAQNVFVAGAATLGAVTVALPKFPTTAGVVQADHDAEGGANNVNDAFVAKFNAAGNALEYATYLGGTGADLARGLAVDAAGNAYVVGKHGRCEFPRPRRARSRRTRPDTGTTTDGFVAKLDPTGAALVYSTYFGSVGRRRPTLVNAIAIDGGGFAHHHGPDGRRDSDVAQRLRHRSLWIRRVRREARAERRVARLLHVPRRNGDRDRARCRARRHEPRRRRRDVEQQHLPPGGAGPGNTARASMHSSRS